MIKGKILVVDDTVEVIDLLNVVLSSASYKVYVAKNGRLALDVAQNVVPDLIIMDVMMPEMNGFESCKKLKEIPITKDIPVLFLSALGKTADKVKAFEHGGVDYITKPVEREELLARVHTHLTIVELQKQLTEKNKELEIRVNKRTAELNRVNMEISEAYYSLKETSKALEKSEMRYKRLSNLTHEGILFHRDGLALDMNNSFIKLFGYTKEELHGQNLIKLLIPEKYHRMIATKHSKRISEIYCIEGIRKNKTIFPLELLDQFIQNDDDNFIVTAFRDITLQRQLEISLLNSVIDTEEKERSNFARELHDGLGPVLSMLKMFIEWLLSDSRGGNREEIKIKTKETIEEAITILREISNNISPHILMEYGLESALQTYASKLPDLCNIAITIDINVKQRLKHITEITLYRILIENINNTRKYAEATNIHIALTEYDENIQVRYTDNGKGFDIEQEFNKKEGMGIYNMYNRIKTIGGKMEMKSQVGKGYELIINLNK